MAQGRRNGGSSSASTRPQTPVVAALMWKMPAAHRRFSYPAPKKSRTAATASASTAAVFRRAKR